MTKAPEGGENEFTDAVRREAAATGRPVCDILKDWRQAAARKRDRARLRKIQQAEKFLGCRNRRRRGKA